MMPNHHPDELILAEYSSNALGDAQSVFIASHLTLCPQCRSTCNSFDQIGGVGIEENEATDLNPETYDKVLDQLDAEYEDTFPTPIPTEQLENTLSIPFPIHQRVIDDPNFSNWKQLINNIYYLELETSDPNSSIRLMKLPPKTKIPSHTHGGSEYTMVLSGSFFDKFGNYESGDVAIRDESETHKPIVDSSDDCICLVVTEAPLELKGPIGFLAKVLNFWK